MNWETLLSTIRTGQEERTGENHHDRTQFQRDWDRLIFSSPFRRLQDKTQVFPLPGSVFVHNRLTHSLEVASVGRSLGNQVSRKLKELNLASTELIDELGSIVAAACLAHDLGNPPFGHSGEKAISHYFKNGVGQKYQAIVDNQRDWNDLISFEGNANTLRILTHQFKGRRKGGFGLTYSTVASIIKYPFAAKAIEKPKYGYFNSEKQRFLEIANKLGLKKTSTEPLMYARHPLVYLVEAADDICYQLMDIEDAHKLKILSTEETKNLMLGFFSADDKLHQRFADVCLEVSDINEQIAFLRAQVIGKLVETSMQIFIQNHQAILNGTFEKALIDRLTGVEKVAMEKCIDTAFKRIYRHKTVVEIEISGFKIIGTLLDEFLNAVFAPKEYYSGLLLPLIPEQFKDENQTPIEKIRSVLDFISGMTDIYALDLYRKIKGLEL